MNMKNKIITYVVLLLLMPAGWLHVPKVPLIRAGKPADTTLNQENVAHYIMKIGIIEPLFVFKQAMYETGFLESNLAKKHNNLFGMKRPGRWKSKAERVVHWNYLSYNHWKLSIEDYKTYQDSFVRTPPEQHFKRSRYSETKNYYKKVNSIKINYDIWLILTKCENISKKM